ncbi:MAG: PA0069 family radical SAM protein [Verrucomicrobia bacterium]|nr:PA0069 family radical SAM protein [Verrucomicrobiota bacterium]
MSQLTSESSASRSAIPGRGASFNPANRFEKLRYEMDEWCDLPVDSKRPQTELYSDNSQTIISYNSSPDVGFSASLNPYRGCEHGCSYCYARPTHEYLGFSAGLDFESRIMVKKQAPDLLASELSKRSWRPQVLVLSGVTDAYQPAERALKITRGCMRILTNFRNPVAIVTKSHLVCRDIDILQEMASFNGCAVTVSITTLDSKLAQVLEPRASAPRFRLDTVRQLRDNNIPCVVNVAPVIPGLNDHEIPKILEAAADAGAGSAFFTMIRLPLSVAPIFIQWLETYFPQRKEKILSRIRSMRHGKLNSSEFTDRMVGDGPIAENIRNIFRVSTNRVGLSREFPRLNTASFRRLQPGQSELNLFS